MAERINPERTRPAEYEYDSDGAVVRLIEHFRQGDVEYSIVTEIGGSRTMKYSTLSIKRELAKIGAWEATKSLLEQSGYWDDFVLANYLSENDPVFSTAREALVSAGIVTQGQLDALLPLCMWSAD